ncbi:MAG: STAS domain-containing protein [Steroidobacteraceae bacterium]
MLKSRGANDWSLSGRLGVADVAGLHAQGLREFGATLASQQPVRVDLAGITGADSAILALLVDWYAWAQRQGVKLSYHAAPDALRSLARLSEVEQWLFASATA